MELFFIKWNNYSVVKLFSGPSLGGLRPPKPPCLSGGLRPPDPPSSTTPNMSSLGHDTCSMIIVHACPMIVVLWCKSYDRTTMILVRMEFELESSAIAASLGHSIDRSIDRSIGRSLDRPLDRSLGRSLQRSLDRTLWSQDMSRDHDTCLVNTTHVLWS